MRGALWLVVLLGSAALADELPPNACLGHLRAGDACLTEEGVSGTCVEKRFQYEDDGRTVTQTELICEAAVAGAERSALPWFGAGLAFLALCAGVATRKPLGPRVQSGA